MDTSSKTIEHDDSDLVYFYEHFETILASAKPNATSIAEGADFAVFSHYFVDDIRGIQQQLVDADDSYLLYVCEHIFNIIDWITLIVENRTEDFNIAFENLFETEFGDKKVLHNLYDTSFDRWISNKNGQYKIGENTYSIANNCLYYRNRFGNWFKVDKSVAFDISPAKEQNNDETLAAHLNKHYQDTDYDLIIKKWEGKDYRGTLSDDFSQFSKQITSPEEYFDFTVNNIHTLLSEPLSIAELERWNGEDIIDLEDKVKLCAAALNIVQERRKDDSHTVYLLRDCMIFYEINTTLDILSSEQVSSDQLLIGRKTLSHKPDQWGYYVVILETLYEAHKRYSDNFSEFYEEFVRLLDLFTSVNSGFMEVIEQMISYIKEHIHTDKDKIVIFDVGFQGSINLFIKYVIDRYIHPSTSKGDIQTDIEVAVGAEWSKELFGNRMIGDYFPLLNRFQRLARSDELYHYIFGSLHNGQVQVTMGNEQWQRKAAIELVVLVTMTQLAQSDN